VDLGHEGLAVAAGGGIGGDGEECLGVQQQVHGCASWRLEVEAECLLALGDDHEVGVTVDGAAVVVGATVVTAVVAAVVTAAVVVVVSRGVVVVIVVVVVVSVVLFLATIVFIRVKRCYLNLTGSLDDLNDFLDRYRFGD